jgi:hypothetical protein
MLLQQQQQQQQQQQTMVSMLIPGLWGENKEELIEAMAVLKRILDCETQSPFDDDDDNCIIAELLDAPRVVCQIMSRYEECYVIQKQGCQVLSLMSLSGCEDEILAVGGLERAILAMEYFPDSCDILESACQLIASLVSDKVTTGIVVAGGGLDAAIFAMCKMPNNARVQYHAINILRVLLEEGTTRAAMHIAAVGGYEEVISAMTIHARNKEIQLEGCMILWLQGKLFHGCRQQIILAHGLVALSEAVRIHGDDNDITRSAKMAMTVLLAHE